MTTVPVTLVSAAVAILINFWLGWRIASYRDKFKVSVGDGGHEPLLRRMRAQANFVENAPFFLIVVAGLELSGANRLALGVIAAVFLLARISHGIGMDGAHLQRWRMFGMIGTALPNLAIAIWAILCAAEYCLGG
jgi:uncharacterized membrane protein YecN with MAPEG domain